MSFEKKPAHGAGCPEKQKELCIVCLILASSEQSIGHSWKASYTFWLYADYAPLNRRCQGTRSKMI
jgi:hypothetical protein